MPIALQTLKDRIRGGLMTEANRNMQMVRLQKLIDFLSHSKYGYTVEQLHEKLIDQGLSCVKRTVYRDLEAMQAMGYPLKEDKSVHKWKLETEGRSGHAFHITPQALIGLYVLKGLAAPLMESAFSSDLNEFFGTIDSKLGEKGREYLGELSNSVHFSKAANWGAGVSSDILHTIQSACSEKQTLEVEYESIQNGRRTRKLGPQSLYFAQGSFYLIAEDLADNKVKTYALPRFSRATMLDEIYEFEGISVSDRLQNSFAVFLDEKAEVVELLFEKELALYIKERRWHETQTLHEQKDGRVVFKAKLGVTPDFVGWVMSFGDKVEVIGPSTLADEIQRIISQMAQKYGLSKAS